MTVINSDLKLYELYETFIVTKYRIGSTQYKKVDYSLMLTTIFIKNFQDKKFRPIKDFFGENASIEAQKQIHDWMWD